MSRCHSSCGAWGFVAGSTSSTITCHTPPVRFSYRRTSRRPFSLSIYAEKTARRCLLAAAETDDHAHQAILPAGFSRHLLCGAHTVPRAIEANSDEYKVMGLASYGQPRFADTVATMVRFENGRLRNDNSWFAFHTGSAHLLLTRVSSKSLALPAVARSMSPPNPTGTSPPAAREFSRHAARHGECGPGTKQARATCAWPVALR